MTWVGVISLASAIQKRGHRTWTVWLQIPHQLRRHGREASAAHYKLFDHVHATPALRNNTLILVCSDNGPEPGAGSAGPFRSTKATLYEGGIRSPLIAWAPGFMNKSKA